MYMLCDQTIFSCSSNIGSMELKFSSHDNGIIDF